MGIHPGGLLPSMGTKVVPGGERELLVGLNDTLMKNDKKALTIPREDLAEVVVQCALEPQEYSGLAFDLVSKDPSLGGEVWNRNLKALLQTLDGQLYDYSKPQHPLLDNVDIAA